MKNLPLFLEGVSNPLLSYHLLDGGKSSTEEKDIIFAE
jgi:hypothetical protein